MLGMNNEQTKSLVRGFIATFGGMIAGFFAAKGWFTIDQVMSVLNSETVIGIIASIVSIVWGIITHTQSNSVAIANAIPEVKGVIMHDTQAGKALADSVTSTSVTTAGSASAMDVARK